MTDKQPPVSPPAVGGTDETAPIFGLEKIYVRDCSVEVPGAPACFLETEPPQLEVTVHTGAQQVTAGLYDVMLHVELRATHGDKVAFLVDVMQCGLFRLDHVPDTEAVSPILKITCPNILLPFARETVADAIGRAGFPPFYLAPMNFEALYLAQLEQQQEQQTEPSEAATP